MNIVELAQYIGLISIGILVLLDIFLAAAKSRFSKDTVCTALMWTGMYLFMLFVLRGITILQILPQDAVRVISGFTSPIPLIAVAIQFFWEKKVIHA